MNKHLQYIDSLICVCCGKPNPTHHHLLRVNQRYLTPTRGTGGLAFPKYKTKGMGIKNDDKFTLPLCPKCHQMLHLDGNETAFFRYLGINCPEELALDLYSVSGDIEQGINILRGARL